MLARLACFVLALASCITLAGCGERSAGLLFHAGAGQRSSLDEIGQLFAQRHPGVRVDFSYKGSGYFLADIAASKEGDLYMPGEAFYVEQAVQRGYVESYDLGSDTAAYFVPVILTPRGNPKGVRTVADFARPGVRVGLGDPEACAVGVWHKRILEKAGIYARVKRNAVMNAQCIPELGNAVKLRAIDATIVWTSTAVLYLRDAEIVPMQAEYVGVVPLPIVVLRFSRHQTLAQDLRTFVLSSEAKAIFHKHAYTVDPSQTAQDIRWLVAAAEVAKDPSIPITSETCGHLVGEVRRQRR
jgi:molybdate transport system substrate-binding protein